MELIYHFMQMHRARGFRPAPPLQRSYASYTTWTRKNITEHTEAEIEQNACDTKMQIFRVEAYEIVAQQ